MTLSQTNTDRLGDAGGFDVKRLLLSREIIVGVMILITAIAATMLSPYFLTAANIKNVVIGMSIEMIVAIGLTIVLLSGGIDLSVGSVVALSAVVIALAFNAGLSIPVAIAAGLCAGVVVGLVNGYLIAYVGLNPLITTLGTMTIFRSAVYILSGGYAMSSIPGSFKALANGDVVFGLPNLVVLVVVLVVLFHMAMWQNVWFRKFSFLGGSEMAALRAGINVKRLKLMGYVICSVLAALGGVVVVARLGSAFPNTATGMELRVITAVIVGGCSIYGGRGTVLGAALGVLFLALVNNILVLNAVSVYWQGVASGCVLILAVLSDAIINRGKRS
ncbi:ABC transporter permease [Sulfitobacter sp. M368]|jgi:ribose transport system permease protein|uniref:ABC transporter permease n=1 Tax=Sulfitobacter sp. M368 TaxID=2867021 RepID=UPI0021A8F054|nr:ABC transporter permease [Sulfitobacter sp. M368]UWR14737.1 ABC transporter permease [Sulfitobacter sp. M368]